MFLFSGALASSEEVIPTPGDSMKDLDKASIPNAGGNFLKLFLNYFKIIFFSHFKSIIFFFIFSGDKENVPKKSNIMFVRGENQSQSVLEAEKEPTVNPDAIDLDSDDDSDEVRNFNQWALKNQFSIIIISKKNFARTK